MFIMNRIRLKNDRKNIPVIFLKSNAIPLDKGIGIY
jgi:hypothetical protein